MALSIEARQIINILDEEGFGFLAGEILTEISLGREIDSDGDEDALRETIPEEGQLEEIIRMLQQRLVAPVRGLAEAERIAGNIQGTSPVRIGFIDEDGNEIQRSESPLPAGDSGIADKLDDLLRRIPQMIDPDLTTRT